MAESTYLYVRRASVYSKEVAARRVTKSFSPNGSGARAQPPHITLAESERICSWCWFASTQKRVHYAPVAAAGECPGEPTCGRIAKSVKRDLFVRGASLQICFNRISALARVCV